MLIWNRYTRCVKQKSAVPSEIVALIGEVLQCPCNELEQALKGFGNAFNELDYFSSTIDDVAACLVPVANCIPLTDALLTADMYD